MQYLITRGNNGHFIAGTHFEMACCLSEILLILCFLIAPSWDSLEKQSQIKVRCRNPWKISREKVQLVKCSNPSPILAKYKEFHMISPYFITETNLNRI